MKLCVIGDPVGHSLSPLLHGAMLRRSGIEGSYQAVTVTAETLPAFIQAARSGAWDGCNVTMPLKRAILSYLDELSPAATACGAVNTVCFRNGRALGDNTDAPGIAASLAAWNAADAGPVLLLGNGGAAQAARWALENRPLITAARRGGDVALAELPRAAKNCTLLLNATPLGMTDYPALTDFSFLDGLAEGAVVFDLVYQPRRTALLMAAEQRGLTAIGGLELLVQQAMLSFARFTGVEPEPDLRRALLELVK